MGEVTENIHTFALPNESQPYTFKMKYRYDSWNRVQSITYPDGEVVSYWYDRGGMLRNMEGQKGTQTFKYIDKIYYNRYGLKDAQWYGNGTHAHYTYDILQRLSHLTSYNSANAAMQDITYTYDKASNVTRINNTAGIVNTLGEIYSYTYTYDSLYRLTYSYGSVGRGKPLANYTLNMQYEADGRITQKNQSGRTRLNGTTRTFNDSKSYTYNTSQPHTVRTVGSTSYQWDANGNMVKDGGAVLTWDEENRLKEVNKSAYGVCFLYDAGGERFYKNSGPKQIMLVNGLYYMNLPLYDDPVLYTSPYLVATPDGYTKHYFVESERFASRIGDGTITGLNTHATTASALAAKQAQVNVAAPDSVQPNKLSSLLSLPFNWSAHHTTYWQHSDHLGSASWVTDTNGAAYQHLQYMPWGEPLLDQRKSGYTYNTRYTFSGKERDEETGYSYFGARHYNSDLSIWLSVDPMADKYPSTSPYTYCANNPVRLVDADGREIGIPPFGIGIGIGIGTVIDGLIYKQKAKCSTMTISGNLQAVRHYYWGGGHKVKLDSKYTTLLMNTEKFKKMHQKIINGKITTSGYFAIDMTKEKDAFFIGRTGVAFNISTSEDGKINTVAYTLFTYQNQPDGFSDPNFIIENIMPQLADGKGSNLELGGTPYDFIPQKIKIEYPNPKYHEVQ